MARPSVLATWATNANYPAGILDWSGQPIRRQPTSPEMAAGFAPNTDLPADYLNFLIGNAFDWISYVDQTPALPFFGTGVDADPNIGAAATVTLARDMFYQNLTIAATGTLNTSGWRVFVNGTLTLNGTISCDGAPGGGAAGSGATGGHGGGCTGTAPNDAIGTLGFGQNSDNGVTLTNALGGNGGVESTAFRSPGVVSAPAATAGWSSAPTLSLLQHGVLFSRTGMISVNGGASGAPTNNAAGGGGGVVLVCARTVVAGASGTVSAHGGAGAPGGGGISGGGGGGVIFFSYRAKTGTVTYNVNGGASGGAGSGAGTAGTYYEVAM